MSDDNELSESELLAKLPKFMRILEDDGTITVVRTADATVEQLLRHSERQKADGEAYVAMAEEMRRMALAEIRGEVPKGTAAAYVKEQQPFIKRFKQLYDFSN